MFEKVLSLTRLVREKPHLMRAFFYSCLQQGPRAAFKKVKERSEGYRQDFSRYRYTAPKRTQAFENSEDLLSVVYFSSIMNQIASKTSQYVLICEEGSVDDQRLAALADRLSNLKEPKPGAVYFDSDQKSANGVAIPHFRPDFSFEYLMSQNFWGNAIVLNADFVSQLGGFVGQYVGRAVIADILFRMAENKIPIVHLPEIFFHEENFATESKTRFTSSFEVSASEKESNLEARRAALKRRGVQAVPIESSQIPGIFEVVPKLETSPLVTIIVPFKDGATLLDKCFRSIFEKTTYRNFEVLGVNNRSEKLATFEVVDQFSQYSNFKRLDYDEPFNYSAINNFAVTRAQGDFVVMLNSDIEIISSDWLESLLCYALQDDVGAVGALLFYPDYSIQHAGIIIGIGEVAGHSHKRMPVDQSGYFLRPFCAQEVSGVTAACLMVRKKYYLKIGGLDEQQLGVLYNDVDFCLKLREEGFRNIYTPRCQAIHHESKTRGHDFETKKNERNRRETKVMVERYGSLLEKADPFYSPHLTKEKEDFSLAEGSVYFV